MSLVCLAGQEWILATLSQLGKVVITAAFGLTWLFTAELYPTKYRSLAMGTSSFYSRIGAFWSPYVNDIMVSVAPRFDSTPLHAVTVAQVNTAGFLLSHTINSESVLKHSRDKYICNDFKD